MYLGGISSLSAVLGEKFNDHRIESPKFFESRHAPLVCVWLLTIAVFSMFPLLQRYSGYLCFKRNSKNIIPAPISVNILILLISRDLLSLPTLSLLGCFLILCHYFKKLEPVTTFEHTSNDLPKKGLAPSSVSPHNSASRSMKGRKSPLPKLISETELQSQIWSWMDWIWWTAFNCSIGKLVFVKYSKQACEKTPYKYSFY